MTPRRFLARAFRRIAYEIDHSLFEPSVTAPSPRQEPLAIAPIANDKVDEFDPLTMAQLDQELSGWYNVANSELYPGFDIGPADIVADIGCGTGTHAQFCAGLGAKQLILLEANEAKLNVARSQWADADARAQTHVCGTLPFPIADASCTRVICNEVLEHVEDPAAFLAELVRIGAPGARYLLSVPAPFGEHVLKHIAHPNYFAPPNHIRIIETDEFHDLVTNAGLRVEAHTSWGAYVGMRWWMFWCEPQPSAAPRHPVLDHLAYMWNALLKTEHGLGIKRALDTMIPKSQVIIATKP